ncbi:unnamed protein product [Mycetohabitans rhizoxinica HKI 454]|uniref:Uncharacterized protein n=2 Tax=Mycetohabitans rhizoxinica TaxID=412963 RepID=E5AMU8_MYCRK|nr:MULTISPECIES: hypothetical protein [Mycetohabitans]MCG1046303.1 hypothetical protein [Mycetohabitans sp. B6]CBW74029.1 unnamed protein product [Mycetohabitans rhizoxinica HKI 454]
MKSKTAFEWFRWVHNVLLWFIVAALIVTISELIAGPALQWLLYDIPYQLPTWNRAGRMVVFVVVSSLLIGTLIWF